MELMEGFIKIKAACQNNLKGFDLQIPVKCITVVTGVSGAGKSTLAFDILYAEGQRRYIETFSPYARQFMDRMNRPDVERIEGIPPALAIEQGDPVRTSRSTVGTVTEINDYVKLLFAKTAVLHCRGCGRPVEKSTPQSVYRELSDQVQEGSPIVITFPLSIDSSCPERSIAQLKAEGLHRQWKRGKIDPLDAITDCLHSSGGEMEIVADRLPFRTADRKRIVDSSEAAFRKGNGRLSVHLSTAANADKVLSFSTALECAYCNIGYKEAIPNLFSFNSPAGACPTCRGFGRIIDIDPGLVVPDPRKSIHGGAIKPWAGIAKEEFQDLLTFCKRKKISVDVPFSELEEKDKKAIFEGDSGFYGVKGFFQWLETKRYKLHVRVFLSRYRSYIPCGNCGGSRLSPNALLWLIGGKSIADLYSMPIEHLHSFFQDYCRSGLDEAAALLAQEIKRRLGYMAQVGLGYLSLDRQSRTLSGGEIERVSLTKALGASLVNTLYILDEPTVGLHPRDSGRLIGLLKKLRDQGNTIVIVEHDPEIISAADNVVDLGPGAGEKGGCLIHSGPLAGLLMNKDSLTGRYLNGALASRRRLAGAGLQNT